jgi:hypothetical protein
MLGAPLPWGQNALHCIFQPHDRCADLGPCLAIGLSTTRYRSNAYSHHEVWHEVSHPIHKSSSAQFLPEPAVETLEACFDKQPVVTEEVSADLLNEKFLELDVRGLDTLFCDDRLACRSTSMMNSLPGLRASYRPRQLRSGLSSSSRMLHPLGAV